MYKRFSRENLSIWSAWINNINNLKQLPLWKLSTSSPTKITFKTWKTRRARVKFILKILPTVAKISLRLAITTQNERFSLSHISHSFRFCTSTADIRTRLIPCHLLPSTFTNLLQLRSSSISVYY